jgi:hypothetical protein
MITSDREKQQIQFRFGIDFSLSVGIRVDTHRWNVLISERPLEKPLDAIPL